MAININDLYKFVQFISNKEQSGYLKPSEFNMAVDRAQMQLFMERYNNPAEYQPGRPIPRVSYQQTQKISDDLRPFMKRSVKSLTNGKMLWSSLTDYIHISSLRINYTSTNKCGETNTVKKKVKLVDDAELSNYLDSTILAPSEKYPIAAIYNGFLQLYPENIQKLDITYLSRPQRPEDGQFWRYEVEDGLPMYNAALSTNLAWSDELFNEIAVRVLSFIGINLRETILSQYSEMKKTQGI
jgi:hypothetical protein